MEFMKDKTMGSYAQLVEVGRKYQADSKIMFDKMQDFSFMSQNLLKQVEDSTRSVEAIKNATSQSANAVATLNDEIAGVASALSDISVENEGIEALAHKIVDGI